MNTGAMLTVVAFSLAACATGPLDYRAEAPVTASLPADSLQRLSRARARSLGLTLYSPDSARARLADLGLGVNTSDDFMYADRTHGCGLFCKQVDFVIVTFCDCGGEQTVQVDAGSNQRPPLLAEWRLVKPSSSIRAAADSLAATFGAKVRSSEIH